MEGAVENTQRLKGRLLTIPIIDGTLSKKGYVANAKIRQYKEQRDEASGDLTQ